MRSGASLRSLLAAALLVAGFLQPARVHAAQADFPLPEALRSPMAFWMRIYLEVHSNAGLLHDASHLGVVYETLRFEPDTGRRTRQKQIDARRKQWKLVLRAMAKGQPPQNRDQETILRLLELELGHPPKPVELRRAANEIRFQLGQRDKFRAGIIRAGAYENVMRSIFREDGLPEDLATLPHVESSFNLKAYSKYGAAGVWQFMRSTGRRFMRIDYIVDERLDPILATRAASRLLKGNYETLGNWPLAITAYNHGVAGIKRASRRLGTKDLATIIRKYHSRTFGFASRNFYAQFLAARKIVKSHQRYFGKLDRDEPEVVDETSLPFFLDVADLDKHLRVPPEVVAHYNLSLRPPVFRSGKRIPRGFVLRLPAGTVGPELNQWLAALPDAVRYKEQKRSKYYTVRRGDTLSKIAARHRTSVGRLVAMNNLRSRHRIYPGQTLQLPDRGASKPKQSFALVKQAQASSAPATIPEPPPPTPKVTPTPPPLPSTAEDSPFRRLDGDVALVETSETLGHFAEWLETSASRLRKLNQLSRRRILRLGQRLRLDFSRVDRSTFLQRRAEFHKAIEEDFFGTYSVTGTINHKLRRGDSLWRLSYRTYNVPTWLIQGYNRDIDLTSLLPGQMIRIPVVERAGGS